MTKASMQELAACESVPACAGIGLRAQHHEDVLAARPKVGWLEVHSENYFARGGAQIHYLSAICERYPLSLHGVGLSLGSVDPIDALHMTAIKRLNGRFNPVLVSEHLSWGSVGGLYANDLLPLPYTEEAVAHVASRIRQVQNDLGRQILIENVSSYLEFRCSRMTEWEFLAAVVSEANCGVLLDINNLFVSARNHGFDAYPYLAHLPCHAVQEIHLAGHTQVTVDGREILVDSHSAAVCDQVWDLYRTALQKLGPKPTLIEWDTDIPPLADLVGEARKADRILEQIHALAA